MTESKVYAPTSAVESRNQRYGNLLRPLPVRDLCKVHCLLLSACVLLCGCGGKSATVTGKVTVSGKPVAAGTIAFVSTRGEKEGYGLVNIAAGEYFKLSVPPGSYIVTINSTEKTGRTVKGPFRNDVEEVINVVPERYISGGTQLTAEVKPGSNTVDFDLTP